MSSWLACDKPGGMALARPSTLMSLDKQRCPKVAGWPGLEPFGALIAAASEDDCPVPRTEIRRRIFSTSQSASAGDRVRKATSVGRSKSKTYVRSSGVAGLDSPPLAGTRFPSKPDAHCCADERYVPPRRLPHFARFRQRGIGVRCGVVRLARAPPSNKEPSPGAT